ncbi:hypothetical protein ACFSQ0_11215 [Mesonia sediminis]|uniref:Uncharacterized protein n=1 Tax=Mesonia sediminis TaxID=1703946 RepID=A0ABW5SFP5_9FLAO
MRNLELIWDFRGPDAEKTAQHHLVHLKEYNQRENLGLSVFKQVQINPMHWEAYLVCPESLMIRLRDALKPHRARLHQA